MKLEALLKSVKPVSNKEVLSAVVNPNRLSPTQNFIKAVESQLELVKWDLEQEGEEPKGRRWYRVKDGKASTFIRYSVKKLKLLPDQTEETEALHVGRNYTDLVKFFGGLITVAKTGELDEIINKAANEMMAERATSRAKNKAKKEADAAAAAQEASE
ncbi:hypothetical protein [Gluconobacter frateurii]|uniref:Phage protein n=1 Tax=Gluconobacter frateurii NRIC 0228 TaxID=1307946 RepID=A0ABQ0QDA5_9PROT|nr:hypothetical protein [Gluconobacter frateurii]GBR14160.1 hypothetical protein AA0228_2190 [Gluconobacter frateurii NRIC 0228]GLP92020.1 hypothetical protein GCM10007868_30950 [Gluconobacter frateurii]